MMSGQLEKYETCFHLHLQGQFAVLGNFRSLAQILDPYLKY